MYTICLIPYFEYDPIPLDVHKQHSLKIPSHPLSLYYPLLVLTKNHPGDMVQLMESG